jgi:hypothetical protein
VDLSSGKVAYNGWTNSLTTQSGGKPADGWEIVSANISPIGVAQYLDKKALQDGMDANDVYEAQRSVTMIVGVYGSTQGRFWDNLQSLLAAFNPVLAYNADTSNVGFLPLTFYQPTAITGTWSTASYPNGIPLQLYCRPAAPPSYDIPKAATSGDSGKGLATHATVQLICRDPRKYLQTAQAYSITTSSQTGAYRGDYNSFPIVTFSLSASGSSAYTLTVHNNSVVINLSALSSGTFTLDFAKRLLTNSVGDPVMSLITSAFFAPIKLNQTGFVALNTTGISSQTLTYYEAWA